MSDEFGNGVFTKSTWHKLEKIGVFLDFRSMIEQGQGCGAWPMRIRYERMRTADTGIAAPADVRAVIASYPNHPDRVLGVNGSRFRATTPEEWNSVIEAACKAGASPTGAFSLKNGSRVLATFEVGKTNGIRDQLMLVDGFDGSIFLIGGRTSIRVVCANTLALALQLDGGEMGRLRHTASLEYKIESLRSAVKDTVESGIAVREAYAKAETMRLTRTDAEDIFDALWPKAPEEADKAAKTRAENARAEGRAAMALSVNNAGPTLATLWNGATFLVDRTEKGEARPTRGSSDPLDAMLFGSRGKKIQEIGKVIEAVMTDGRIVPMTAYEASDAGIDPRTIGRTMLDDMLGD